jgi:hypothetical protein
MQLVTSLIDGNHRCGRSGRLYDELRSRRYPISRSDVQVALRYIDPRVSGC